MTLNTAIYELNKNAFAIMAEAKTLIPQVASDAIDALNSEKQPRLYAQLIKLTIIYDQLNYHFVYNGGSTAIIGVRGENVSVINIMLRILKQNFDL